MPSLSFPPLAPVRQNFPRHPLPDLPTTLAAPLELMLRTLPPGRTIGVALGSRGIDRIFDVARCVIDTVRRAGHQAVVIPAMGSHGGATPTGQLELLAGYGLTPASLGVPFEAEMDVQELGRWDSGQPILWSRAALRCDGVLVINRVKPHTDFAGTLGSGLIKMAVVGLGKHAGAAAFHRSASRDGYEPMLRRIGAFLVQNTPLIGGIALIEDAWHQLAAIEVLPAASWLDAEPRLVALAGERMARLPFDEIDLLIVDRIGKNISGGGMDPNVIRRPVHGYSTELNRQGRPAPFIRRIFVRDLTPETHGNAIGIGMADLTTTRLIASIDPVATRVNAFTALTPNGAKIPAACDRDDEAIALCLASLGLPDADQARVVRIPDTLSLSRLLISEALLDETRRHPNLEILGPLEPWRFALDGNLPPFPA